MVLSVGSMTVTYSTIEYLYRRGAWNADSAFGRHLQMYYAWAILASLILAITGIFRDRNIWISLVAFVLSMFGILTVATG
jgi:hypothetical protein